MHNNSKTTLRCGTSHRRLSGTSRSRGRRATSRMTLTPGGQAYTKADLCPNAIGDGSCVGDYVRCVGKETTLRPPSLMLVCAIQPSCIPDDTCPLRMAGVSGCW